MSSQRQKRKRRGERITNDNLAASSSSHNHENGTSTCSKLTATNNKRAKKRQTDSNENDGGKADTSPSSVNSRGLTESSCNNENTLSGSQQPHDHKLQWNRLPHVLLVKIFTYLDPIGRRQASLTCTQWRECYFYPSQWRDVQLCASGPCWQENNNCWNGAEVVLKQCGQYIKNLHIFPFTTLQLLKEYITSWTQTSQTMRRDHVECYSSNHPGQQMKYRVDKLLQMICVHCTNLETFELKIPDISSICVPENISVTSISISTLWKQIECLLGKCSSSMQHLMLSNVVDIINTGRLEQVAKFCGNTLKSLHCASFSLDVEQNGDHLKIQADLDSFKLLNQLTDLRLNIVYVTDELLTILSSTSHCPMKVIDILISSQEDRFGPRDGEGVVAMTNQAWEAMVSHSPELQVGVVCHYRYGRLSGTGSNSNTLPKVLEMSAIPLRWLKIISGAFIMDDVFRLLQSNFAHVLHRLELIHVPSKSLRANFMLSSPATEQNPVVMTIWQCSHLAELVITGFKVTSDDIVGIARIGTRLRGDSLKVLGIQESCIGYENPVETKEELITEVRKCLGEDWKPLDNREAELFLWEIMDRPLLPDIKYGTGPMA